MKILEIYEMKIMKILEIMKKIETDNEMTPR